MLYDNMARPIGKEISLKSGLVFKHEDNLGSNFSRYSICVSYISAFKA